MKNMRSRLLVLCACLLTFGVLLGQVRLPKIKIPKDIPGLDDILKGEPPLTTSIEDAVTEVPFLDDYNPESFMPLTMLPRTPEGGFILERTGDLEFEAESYCLKAGTYGPSGDRGGSGYLHAPQKGPLADVIRNIIQRAYLHPDISQEDIQILLWAIVARAKFSDLSRENQITAAKILTPQEILRVNGGALGLIPDSLRDLAFEKLPPAARRVLEAEAELRSMLTGAQATYEELERVAVLSGDPPTDAEDRQIPSGRWSLHPDGYFIRYFPHGYREIRIELSVPAPLRVEYDDRGRISLIADRDENRLEAEYDDAVGLTSLSGEPSLKGYAFRSLRFVHPDPEEPGKKLSAEWAGVGWTFVGVPSGRGRGGQESDRFPGVAERYLWAQKHRRDLERLAEGFEEVGIRNGERVPKASEERVARVMALAHFAMALGDVFEKSGTEHEGWILDPVNLVKRAWQYEVTIALAINMGVGTDAEVSGQAGPSLYSQEEAVSPGPIDLLAPGDLARFRTFFNHRAEAAARSGENNPTFNPADGMAQPGQRGSQRLNQSSRAAAKQKCQDKAREQLEADLKKCWDQSGPGGIPPWDPWELYQCLVAYPKGQKHKCLNRYIPPQPDEVENYPALRFCLLNAGTKWLDAHEKCR